MAYSPSEALVRWRTDRKVVIETLRAAHGAIAQVTGAGRPLGAGKPVAHAYVLVICAEFQGFLRDLHDLSIDHLVSISVDAKFAPQISNALRSGRALDRGNADERTLQTDFRRIGMLELNAKLGAVQPKWALPQGQGDKKAYATLIQLRNCYAHGNQEQLDQMLNGKVKDTVSWADRQLPGLNRTARAIDRVVWNHLKTSTGSAPW